VNRHAVNYIFNTEGHLFPISAFLRQPQLSEDDNLGHSQQLGGGANDDGDVRHSRRKDVETPLESGDSADMKVVLELPRLNNLTFANVSLYHVYSCSLFDEIQ